MDPTANLKEQLRITNLLLEEAGESRDMELAERLAELVYALNEWISGGGFLPQEWAEGRARCADHLCGNPIQWNGPIEWGDPEYEGPAGDPDRERFCAD